MSLTAEMTVCRTEQERPESPPTLPDDEPVNRETVVVAIRRDCLLEPARYLEEVRVPFGGE